MYKLIALIIALVFANVSTIEASGLRRGLQKAKDLHKKCHEATERCDSKADCCPGLDCATDNDGRGTKCFFPISKRLLVQDPARELQPSCSQAGEGCGAGLPMCCPGLICVTLKDVLAGATCHE